MLKALIWDVDGTLVDSEELHRVAFNQAFAEFGLDWSWSRAEYTRLLEVAGGKERIRSFAGGNGRDRPAFCVDELHVCKTYLFQEGIRAGKLSLRPGVARLLDEARNDGIRLAIATTTTASNVQLLFESGILDPSMWETVVAADTVAHKKPAPDVYLEALSRLGFAPRDCLAVEDSRNGLLAALGANIPTVITRNAYTAHHNFAGALVVTSGLGGKSNYTGQIAWRVSLAHLEAWHAVAVMPDHVSGSPR